MKRLYFLLTLSFITVWGQNIHAQSQRKVLIEKGTNASCGPCAAQNPGFHSMLNTVDDKHVAIHYQWYFPGYDPMNEHNPTEANTRFANYYGNNGVPTAMIDGVIPNGSYPGFNGSAYDGAPAGYSASMINNRYAVSSPFEIDITYSVTPSTITADVTVTCTEAINASNLRLRIVVVERVISFDSPPGTNGESTFYNVMKKFMPNTNGLSLQNSWVPGDSQSFSQSWTHQNVYDFSQLAIVAFVQNDANKEVLQAARADNAEFESNLNNAATLLNVVAPSELCSGSNTIAPQFTIRNTGNANLTSCDIIAEINGVESVVNWTGDLQLMSEETITMDEFSFETQEGTNELTITVANTNNEDNEEEVSNTIVSLEAAPEGGDVVLVTIVTDNYGNETYWRIMDEGGNKIAEGGNPNVENNYGTGNFPPPVGSGTYGNGQTYNQEVVIPANGCYTFELFDYYGDGFCCAYGNGSYKVRNVATNQIIIQGTQYLDMVDGKFEGTMASSINENELGNSLLIFPNPVINQVTIQTSLSESADVSIEVYDLTGKVVYAENLGVQPAGTFIKQLNFEEISTGMYLLNIRAGEASVVRKLSVNK